MSVSQGAHPAGWQVDLSAAALSRRILVHGCVVQLGHVADARGSGIAACGCVDVHQTDQLTPLAGERAWAPN